MTHELRGNRKCHKANITLTHRFPITLEEGMYETGKIMAQQYFIDFVLYPEYSRNGMFHFHGTIWYTNKLQFMSFLNRWRRQRGNAKVTEDKNTLAWHFYCRKDQHLMENHKIKRLHHYNIINVIKYYSIFPFGKDHKSKEVC